MGAIIVRTLIILIVGALSLLVLRVLVRGNNPIGIAGLDFLDTRTYRFETLSDIDPRLQESGWIPAIMPRCATDIYLEFNIETNTRVLEFDCYDTDVRNAFVDRVRQKETDFVEVRGKEVVLYSL